VCLRPGNTPQSQEGLLSPHAFGQWDQVEKVLHIKLEKERIQNSPPIDSHRPVSHQLEHEYYHYFGWPAYWEGGGLWGLGGQPTLVVPPTREAIEARIKAQQDEDDTHLCRRVGAVSCLQRHQRKNAVLIATNRDAEWLLPMAGGTFGLAVVLRT